MDDGRITDGQGRVVDAKNCIVVMTSNLGAEYLSRPNGKDGKIDPTTRELVMNALRNYFLPEFLNRINSIGYIQPPDAQGDPQDCRSAHRRDPEAAGRQQPQRVHRHFGGGQGQARQRRLLAGLRRAPAGPPDREGGAKQACHPHPPRQQLRDGELARVELVDGKIAVLPNHQDSDRSGTTTRI